PAPRSRVSGRLAIQGEAPPDARRGRGRAVRPGAGGGCGTMIGPAPGIRLKVCMAGEAAVGKTSLIRRYVLDEYDDRYLATLGTKITKKTLTVQDPKGAGTVTVHAILWDIMGTSTLRDLLKEAYYHGAEGIFTVADKTRQETLGAIDSWVASIRSVAGDIPTVGLVNKQDLEPDPAFASGEIEAFFEKRGWPGRYKSAKTGSGLDLPHRRFLHPEPREVLGAEADPGRLHRRRVPREEVLVRDDVRLLEALRDRRPPSEHGHVEGDRVALREAVLLRKDLDPPLV